MKMIGSLPSLRSSRNPLVFLGLMGVVIYAGYQAAQLVLAGDISGLMFVALYGFIALVVPNAFSNLGTLEGNFAIAGNLIYFSFVTLTTTGFGDIVPMHPYARGLSNVEAIIGQIYPATLLARLVTLELVDERRS